MSVKLVGVINQERKLGYSDDDLAFIQGLISGKPPGNVPVEKHFLFDIVANNTNSIDVDKFDYIARDCHNCGVHANFQPERLMQFSRVLKNHIAFESKMAFNVYQLFHSRYCMHKQVYSHKAVKAIEYMLCEAMSEADDIFRVAERSMTPGGFVTLTDVLFKLIEDFEPGDAPAASVEKICKAQDLIHRVNQRDLYKLADAIHVPHGNVTNEDLIKEEGFKQLYNEVSGKAGVKPDQIIIDQARMDYGFGDKNPVDFTYFYTKHNPTSWFFSSACRDLT
eukprot:TRINITY_DN1991_c0_g1_i2.p1 TRINITY_DN1991_c0_g1~~TRINITY_DN1991_c0_g1_i2.p1  ORF type:complete len:279 (+),score=38.55 TRINITY_DN1991_c0_g1_i2:483-1319(+)